MLIILHGEFPGNSIKCCAYRKLRLRLEGSMTLQQMMVFLAVCEEQNFSRTASKVFMSRQAVRQNITQLEREFGGLLFENHKNHLALTHKGEILKRMAQPVVEKYRELQQVMVRDLHQDHPLRIGVSVSLVPDYLPDLLGSLQAFAQCYPDLTIETVRIMNDEAAPKLLSAELDAAFVLDLGGGHAGIDRTVITSHSSAVLVNNRHPFFSSETIGLKELDGSVMYLPGLGPEFAGLFEAANKAGADISFEVMPNYYQVVFHIMDHDATALNRYSPEDDVDPARLASIPFRDVPPLCSSYLRREGETLFVLDLLRDWVIGRQHISY